MITVDHGLFVYVLEAIARPSRAALSAHTAYLRALAEAVVAAAVFRDDAGAIVCVRAPSDRIADEIARTDPLVAFGFTLYRVHEIETIEQLPAEAVIH